MSEVIYLPEIRCEVFEGWRDTEITVCVRDVNGACQYMQATPTMVNYYSQVPYLPIGIIHVDRAGRRVLVELPNEADSGVNRLWVPFDSCLREQEAVPVA